MDVDDEAFVAEELVEEFAAEVEEAKIYAEVLADMEINEIQAELSSIERPSWHRGPPKNLGDAEHGKLKAEQWRSAIEFDLPVTLMKLWGKENGIGGERRREVSPQHYAAIDSNTMGNITRNISTPRSAIYPMHEGVPGVHPRRLSRAFLVS
jgi:hypothetical protein